MRRRHHVVKLVGIWLLLAGLFSCRNTTAVDDPPPEQVRFVAKSADTVAVEAGIDAEDSEFPHPNRNGVLVEWHPVSAADIASYGVYRRAIDTIGTFQRIALVGQDFGVEDTTYLDAEAGLDTLYYYHIVARDEAGQDGERSKNEHYTLLPKPTLNFPTDRNQFFSQQEDVLFDWTFAGTEISDFIFRIERELVGGEYETVLIDNFTIIANIDPHQTMRLSEAGAPALGPGIYRWRVEVIKTRDDRRGAEASWGFFGIN